MSLKKAEMLYDYPAKISKKQHNDKNLKKQYNDKNLKNNASDKNARFMSVHLKGQICQNNYIVSLHKLL